MRDELGDAPGALFATWDPIPVAAASIGQVHRARTHDGRDVAVKVQYPGVDDAIRADLTTSDVLFRALSLMFPGLDPGPIVDELRARLVEELDYTHEAENQRLFTDYYAGHPFIRIPAVIDELSTRTRAHDRVRGRRALRRGGALVTGGARPRGRSDLPVRVPQPLPPARVQR